MSPLGSRGQATIEYLFLFAAMASILFLAVKNFSEFSGNSMGNFAVVLSRQLTVGVCEEECFFSGYKNGQ